MNRKEDADEVMLIEATTPEGNDRPELAVSFTDNNNSRNPSDRRQGMIIRFECENCGPNGIELCIAQHKGNTIVHWQFEPRVSKVR